MQALQNEKIKNPLVVNLLSKLSYICATSNVVFCWIPSHIGIIGNERADRAATSALSQDILPLKIPYFDFKPLINVLIREYWQSDLNYQIHNKLHSVKPVLGEWLPALRSFLREDIVLARLRFGHM